MQKQTFSLLSPSPAEGMTPGRGQRFRLLASRRERRPRQPAHAGSRMGLSQSNSNRRISSAGTMGCRGHHVAGSREGRAFVLPTRGRQVRSGLDLVAQAGGRRPYEAQMIEVPACWRTPCRISYSSLDRGQRSRTRFCTERRCTCVGHPDRKFRAHPRRPGRLPVISPWRCRGSAPPATARC